MRLVSPAAAPTSTTARPAPGAPRLRPLAVLGLVLLTGLGATPAAWAGPISSAVPVVPTSSAAPTAPAGPGLPGTVTLTVQGTVEHAVVDRPHAADDADHAEPGEGLELDTMVEVDGEIYDVPEAVAPDAGDGPDDVRAGDPVTITLQAPRGVDATEALEAAGAGDDATGRVLDVEAAPAASADPTTGSVAPLPTTTSPFLLAPAVTAPAITSVVGDHTLTLLPVTWAGTSYSLPSRSALTTLANDAATYWSEQSGGRVAFRATARDWLSIPDPGQCDTTAIMRDALAAHRVAAPTGNAHVAVYFPERDDCGGWAGMGSIRGGRIWINGVPTVDVLAHELGHNLGLGHANTATCLSAGVRVSLSAECSISPYADIADVMGFGTTMATGNLNTALADQLGLATVLEVSQLPATVDIARLADVGSPRAVRLATAFGTVYVDFRPAQGRDVRRTAWAGVQVHRLVDSGGYPESHLLDMQPTTRTAFSATALPVNGSWNIPGSGQTLTVVSTGTTTARLSLTATGSGAFTKVPAVSTVVPAGGGTVGGTVVTLTGSGFSGATRVLFGDTPATAVTVLSSTSIRATSPAHARGPVDVRVVTPEGTSPTAPVARFGFHDLVAVDPARLVRDDVVTPGTVDCVQVTGNGGVPVGADTAALNVTTVAPTGSGYVVVYPDDQGTGRTAPPAEGSTVNFDPGADIANATFVRLPSNGKVCYSTRGASHAGVILDVTGYALPGAGVATQRSERLLDTRLPGAQTASAAGRLLPRTPRAVLVRGAAGVPADATGVLLNVTVTGVAAAGHLRVYAEGVPLPGTSVVNYALGRDRAAGTIVAVPSSGRIMLYSDSDAPVDVVLDVVGHTRAGSAYTAITPRRVMDSRPGSAVGPIVGPLKARQVYGLKVAGMAGVPADASAVVLNVVAVGPTGVGNLRVYPDRDNSTLAAPPDASSLNYLPGRDISNLVVVPLPANGRVDLYSDQAPGESVHVAADVLGYVPSS